MRKLHRVLVGVGILVVVASVSLGNVIRARAITGGYDAAINQFGFVARLSVNGRPTCGGTLISQSWVLTAAHCVSDELGDQYPASAVQIAVGVESAQWSRNWRAVSRIVRHPRYQSFRTTATFPYDAALVQLSAPSPMRPVLLAQAEPAVGATVTYLGWGCTAVAPGCQQQSSILKRAETRLIPDARCGLRGAYARSSFCTSTRNASTVRSGDSGGPALVRVGATWRLAGAVSGSNSSIDSAASVAAVQGWIDQTITPTPTPTNTVPPATTVPPPG